MARDTDASSTPTPVSLRVSIGKDLVALLRDSTLLLLGILLIVWPGTFNEILQKAGFEEGSVVGFKWKSKLVEADAALKEAQATILSYKEQNEELEKVLTQVQAQPANVALKEQLQKLKLSGAELNKAATKVAASVDATIASNAPLVQRAQEALDPASSWAVVFGGDTSVDAAKYETGTIAPKLGVLTARVFLRDGSFRSVASARDRAQAEDLLAKLRSRRADAYIVNMARWCPRSEDKGAFRHCVPA
jgi:hypothetical protein